MSSSASSPRRRSCRRRRRQLCAIDGTQQRVGEHAPGDDAVCDHDAAGFRFGGSGTNTETSSW